MGSIDYARGSSVEAQYNYLVWAQSVSLKRTCYSLASVDFTLMTFLLVFYAYFCHAIVCLNIRLQRVRITEGLLKDTRNSRVPRTSIWASYVVDGL